ncbi:MAG: hypothetical protein JWN89_694 [Parcubacteria group bacterium]|nr:hypothetical protein [Parcubacteria group bacterium]
MLAAFVATALFFWSAAPALATDATISIAPTGTAIMNSNTGTTTLASFSPTLGSSVSAGSSAYYGVRTMISTNSYPNVHWRITVHDASGSLSLGDVTVLQKGFFDASSSAVLDSAYSGSASSSDLVFTGASGWSANAGDDLTTVDMITFSSSTPGGSYTITRALIDNGTGAVIDNEFATNVTVNAGTDTTPPAAPIISTPAQSASTSPFIVAGTAEGSSTISILGGASSTSATTSGAGSWNAFVTLTPNTVNHIVVRATDAAGNTSASSSVDITYDTTAPVFGPAPDITVDATSGSGALVTFATPTTTDNFSNSLNAACSPSSGSHFDVGTTTVTCTVTDAAGNSGAATFNVMVNGGSATPLPGSHRHTASAGAVGGSGSGITIALPVSAVTPTIILAPSQVLGASTFQFTRFLKLGMRGDDVMELQTRLAGAGLLKAAPTGYFGKLTLAAVKAFQKSLDLPPTGYVGPMTLAILNNS